MLGSNSGRLGNGRSCETGRRDLSGCFGLETLYDTLTLDIKVPVGPVTIHS